MNEQNWQCRTELLIGKDGVDKLSHAHVMIAGLGGVGGYAAEQLCRAGVGRLTLIDADTINPSNRNRQLIAQKTNEQKSKVQEFRDRLLAINPDIQLTIIEEFIEGDRIKEILTKKPDYLVDAIDTLTPKVDLLATAHEFGIPTVSAMGAGGRVDPGQIFIDDISKSNHCKFAYIVRKYLHRKGIRNGIKVVYSTEKVPESAIVETDGSGNKRTVVGTISYLPAIFGCMCASVVLRDLISKNKN